MIVGRHESASSASLEVGDKCAMVATNVVVFQESSGTSHEQQLTNAPPPLFTTVCR